MQAAGILVEFKLKQKQSELNILAEIPLPSAVGVGFLTHSS